jgi:NADPH:quinone reductase-like Zn-dependent oxidoreductase
VAAMNRTGGYAEYAVFPAISTFHIPDKLSYEEASTLPLALTTAAMAIFRRLPFNLNDNHHGKKTIVVWGASGSVGNYAVQLAKLIGLRVIAVAGASASVAKLAGADVVIDYRDSNILEQIEKALGTEKLQYVVDAVSEKGTTGKLSKLIERGAFDARIVLVLFPSEELPEFISYPQSSVFSVYGEEQNYGGSRIIPASVEDKAFGIKFYDQLETWLREGKIIPNKATVLHGGLKAVSEGFERMRNGQVSGEKFVYRIVETPGLS